MNAINWIRHVRKVLIRDATLVLTLVFIAGFGLVSIGATSVHAASAARSNAYTASLDTHSPPSPEPGLPSDLPALANNPGDWWEVWTTTNGQYFLDATYLCWNEGGWPYTIKQYSPNNDPYGSVPPVGITAVYTETGCAAGNGHNDGT